MTEYVAVRPFIKLPMLGTELSIIPNGSYAQTRRRKCYAGFGRATEIIQKSGSFCFTNFKINHYQKTHDMKCYSLGTLISTAGDSFGWIPVADQVLLATSMFLAHMAVIVPADGPFLVSGKKKLSDNVAPDETPISGRCLALLCFRAVLSLFKKCSATTNNKDSEVNFEFSWDIVKRKLTDSVMAIEKGTKLEKEVMDSGQAANQPSSLSAIAVGPRFRLMWASFQWIKNEVDNISRSTSTADLKNLQTVFFEILQRSSQFICIDWLKEELLLRNRKSIKELPLPLFEKLKGDNSVLQNIKKSGKEGLYSELVYILKFGSLSPECCYDHDFFASRGVYVLEDLVITLADGIASIYLELISVDSEMSNEMNNLGLNLCDLSTRALQKLRNEVSLNQWFAQNMETVASMYEDRFDLRILQSQPVTDSSKRKTETFGWLKNLSLRKSRPMVAPLGAAVISSVRIPVKRTKELRALVGWRYYYSLYLEMADITMPVVRTVVAKISDAVSFFLVCLIGRSLGLIYTGIRQSLRWK